MLYLFYNIVAVTFIFYLINWVNSNFLSPTSSNVFCILIATFFTMNLYCFFIFFLSCIIDDGIFLNNANAKKFFKRKSARDTINRKVFNFLTENVSPRFPLASTVSGKGGPLSKKVSKPIMASQARLLRLNIKYAAGAKHFFLLEKTTLKRLLRLSLLLKTFIFIILDIVFNNKVYYALNMVILLGLYGLVPFLFRVYLMITQGIVIGFDGSTDFLISLSQISRSGALAGEVERTDNIWNVNSNNLFKLTQNNKLTFKNNGFNNFPQGNNQNEFGFLTEDDRRREDKDGRIIRPDNYVYGSVILHDGVETTVPIIKKVIGDKDNNIGPWRIIRQFRSGRVILDAFKNLKLNIDASPATISSISGFQYDKDDLLSRITEAENRLSILYSCVYAENVQQRKEILDNVELLIAYAKVYDTEAYDQIMLYKTNNSNFNMYFNKPEAIWLDKWMISGKTKVLPANEEVIPASYLYLFRDSHNMIPGLWNFMDEYLNFKDPLAEVTDIWRARDLLPIDPDKPIAFFNTALYDNGANNKFKANIYRPEELENLIKIIDRDLRSQYAELFHSRPEESEIKLANLFLNMRIMNSTVLKSVLDKTRDYSEGFNSQFWAEMQDDDIASNNKAVMERIQWKRG